MLVRQASTQRPFWPSDGLVPVPTTPAALPYQPYRTGLAGARFSWHQRPGA